MNRENPEQLFTELHNYVMEWHFYSCQHFVSAEELYQAFKSRIIRELLEEINGKLDDPHRY